jgi:hypothetical protein
MTMAPPTVRAGMGLLALACASCPAPSRAPEVQTQTSTSPEVAELVYQGHLQQGWTESGSAPRDASAGGPERVRFGGGGEWVLSHPGLSGSFGGVLFQVKEPFGEGEFLEVRLGSGDGHSTRGVKLKPDHRTNLADGWTQVLVPMTELNPDGAAFDRLIFKSFRPVGDDWIAFDAIGLTKATAPPKPTVVAVPGGKPARMRASCDAKATKINPLIYGIAFGEAGWETLGASARRWGGNPSSRYNWQTHFNNRASDWFFENHVGSPYTEYIAANAAHGIATALTIPTLGWVAKDGASYSFPVSAFGPQRKTDPWNPDAGDGAGPNGADIPPGPPTRTSVAAPPAWEKQWVAAVCDAGAKGAKSAIAEYILDNEPMLWHGTHRDVHPEPVSYDELLDRTIRYGSAIREACPDAVIAGPAEWGWSGYLYSAKDVYRNSATHADRRAHGDVPLVEWYLRKLHEHEQKTGTRILDVLDLHYYPQEANVYGGGTGGVDKTTQLLRLRSTRSLWDPTYVDESWINEAVRLLPRMKEWVDKNYPGRGISIGEWNFGGEKDITGALAIGEALGRFAEFGVTSAFYWTAPPRGSPGSFGFLAYRNFDGQGGRFLDLYIPTTAAAGTSLFASRDADGKHLVLVALNMQAETSLLADIDVSTCGTPVSQQAYSYGKGSQAFEASTPMASTAGVLQLPLAPWSITTIDVKLR